MIEYRTNQETLMIPLSAVASARKGHQDQVWTVTDVRGGTHQVDDYAWQAARRTTALTSSPAHPGTYLLTLCSEDDGTFTMIRNTVVGWAIYADGVLRPMTLDSDAMMHAWQVEMPDGRVENSMGQVFESADAWFQEETTSGRE